MMTMMVMVMMMKSILDLSVAARRKRISWKSGYSTVMDRMFLCKLDSQQSQKTLRTSVHFSYIVWNNGGWKEKGFGTVPSVVQDYVLQIGSGSFLLIFLKLL